MKTYLVGLFMLVALSATAQQYKPFKVNLSVGLAYLLNANSNITDGFLVAVEPKYGFSDHFDLGLRLEGASLKRNLNTNGVTLDSGVGDYLSYMITGNYLFGTGNIQPFLGAGIGFNEIKVTGYGDITKTSTGEIIQQTRSVKNETVGTMIRGGIKAGHFVAAIEYNAAKATEFMVGNTNVSSPNSYVGFKVGVDFGGARRDMGSRRR
ncbi:outer membrane beta-barrel protein [Spirosoma soli]|uniref:Outer membrane beta-barrel protein n=1 Tax=Spirosoma soli TaxID=1770529 RepID=A0ABW5M6V3_9BACT